MKSKGKLRYEAMKRKISKALRNDTGITVSFITTSTSLSTNKCQVTTEKRKVIHLNDTFIENCKGIAYKNNASIANVIISQLNARKHDNGSKYFLIN